ncbi:2OG-Fe(II) oxygenase [Pseudotabrizicola algicola]|uniref:2OG-Fe(II) oxygenase n=1 Tax=Pseudotabrizicola algicola TaxID=2709381 RepID=A0A6B3RLL0_9RHOB|nr:2OG-Fe(II) oxygenase [Pseudotabrizicola algicola]NEX46954.1 2OG-Fe(II) oxygenase [Pseudotabrizicola algicola]
MTQATLPPPVILTPGDPAPSFTQRSATNPRYAIDTAAGRYLVLCFFHSLDVPQAQEAVAAALSRPDVFDDTHASFFGISSDPQDEARLSNQIPGRRFIWDSDLTASRLYGAAQGDRRSPLWVVTDPTMRVLKVVPFQKEGSQAAEVIGYVASLPPPARFAGPELQAPILYLPNVFEPDLCRHLIGLYDAQGGEESGFMREVDGKTIGMKDRSHKSRRDITLNDPDLIAALQARFVRRVVPQIAKAHQFHVTRMERYIVSCYDAAEGGHFAPHRDNTTTGTAHRRFAVSINLNEDFEGGEVSFPEYGPRSFKAPPGGAVVFSCSLLHRVSTVTRGRRYAFLPFLYDDAAAKIRQANLHALDAAEAATKAQDQ